MQNINYAFLLSRPVWGAWIEIEQYALQQQRHASRPVWGAWIEMINCDKEVILWPVAPRMGRVD